MKNIEYYNVNLPHEVSITETDDGYRWEYRCTNSEDDYNLFFNDVEDALCHLITVLVLDLDTVNSEEE